MWLPNRAPAAGAPVTGVADSFAPEAVEAAAESFGAGVVTLAGEETALGRAHVPVGDRG